MEEWMDQRCLEEHNNLNKSGNLTINYENIEFAEYDYHRTDLLRELVVEDYVKIVAYVAIIVGGLLGNASVILTVALNRSMRTTINFYVANLAVADLLVCMCCMLTHLVGVFTHPVYALGPFMCKFNNFVQMTTLTCSVLTLSAISCDRFIAIMFPLHVRITKQRTSVVISVIWVLSMVVAIPFLIVKKYDWTTFRNFVETRCDETWPTYSVWSHSLGKCVLHSSLKFMYYLFVTVILFFLPVGIMITAYSLILWKLWRSEVPGERHTANINVQSRAKKKVIKMVFVVLVAFVVCWLPLQTAILYSILVHEKTRSVLPSWFVSFEWFSYYIAYANSFMNPIIYGGFNKAFRDGFCVVLRCGLRRRRFPRPRISQRSRMTFTTGVMSSPSRDATKTINGTTKLNPQKPTKVELKKIYVANEADLSPTLKETCVSIADCKTP